MKQKMFSLLLISSFCMISADSTPDATTPREEPVQASMATTTPEQLARAKLDRYLKCKQLLTTVRMLEDPTNTTFAEYANSKEYENYKKSLTEKISAYDCNDTEFKLLLEMLNARAALNEYEQTLSANAAISKATFENLERDAFYQS